MLTGTKIGDVVMLRSGGAFMVVVGAKASISPALMGQLLTCTWNTLDQQVIHQVDVPEFACVLISKAV